MRTLLCPFLNCPSPPSLSAADVTTHFKQKDISSPTKINQPSYLGNSCNNGKSVSSSYLSIFLVVSWALCLQLFPFIHPLQHTFPQSAKSFSWAYKQDLKKLSLPPHFPPANNPISLLPFQQTFLWLPHLPIVNIHRAPPNSSICCNMIHLPSWNNLFSRIQWYHNSVVFILSQTSLLSLLSGLLLL